MGFLVGLVIGAVIGFYVDREAFKAKLKEMASKIG